MSGSVRRIAVVLAIALAATLIVGCTLAGASAAPLTPVEPVDTSDTGDTGDGGEGQSDDGGGDVGETVPTPTEVPPIDVFGTQTAEAPPPTTEPTAEPTEEGGEIIEPTAEGTGEETAEPTEESTEDSAETPEPAETPIPSGEQGECPSTYTIQQGDTLFSIAQRFGLTVNELAAANGITNPDRVAVDTVLNIPGCGEGATTGGDTGDDIQHVVQPGENLFRIALQYGLSWRVVAEYNGLSNPDDLSVGQVILIPQ